MDRQTDSRAARRTDSPTWLFRASILLILIALLSCLTLKVGPTELRKYDKPGRAVTREVDSYESPQEDKAAQGNDMIAMTELTLDIGRRNIPVMMFRAKNDTSRKPAIFFIHGGGRVFPTLDFYNEVYTWLAAYTGMVLFSIEYYREEAVFPYPMTNCCKAVNHLLEHARTYGILPGRTAIVGDSTGGNLAAAVALRRRDLEATPSLKAQVLIYPILQPLNFRLPSMRLYQNSSLTLAGIAHFWLMYHNGTGPEWLMYRNRTNQEGFENTLGRNLHVPAEAREQFQAYLNPLDLPEEYRAVDVEPDITNSENETDWKLWKDVKDNFVDPYFAPGIANDLGHLPRSLVVTVGNDPLRDEAILYAIRMAKHQSDVTHKHFPNCFHGILTQPHHKETERFRRFIGDFLIENV